MQSPLLTRRSWDKLSSTRILNTMLVCRVTEEKRELERYYFRMWKNFLELDESNDESLLEEEHSSNSDAF